VDVIIEIGGQDSKYIKLNNNTISDFVMNKTCAAGTGSFLTEQADRLDVDLNEFSDYALRSENPINVGSRCTVFMETDCIHYQQCGISKEDIIAGLSYSIAKNYLEKVAMNKSFEGKVAIQGGIASNYSVVAAFSLLLGKEITIVPHNEITGAIGIPRMLLYHELYPFWSVFFDSLGYEVILSDSMSENVYRTGLSSVLIDKRYQERLM